MTCPGPPINRMEVGLRVPAAHAPGSRVAERAAAAAAVGRVLSGREVCSRLTKSLTLTVAREDAPFSEGNVAGFKVGDAQGSAAGGLGGGGGRGGPWRDPGGAAVLSIAGGPRAPMSRLLPTAPAQEGESRCGNRGPSQVRQRPPPGMWALEGRRSLEDEGGTALGGLLVPEDCGKGSRREGAHGRQAASGREL